MNNNQNPQVPPNQNLPQHRLDELMGEVKALRDQNQQLRGQIDYISRGQQQQNQQQQSQPQPPKSPFDENIDRALEEKFAWMMQQKLNPLVDQFKQQIGYVVDRTDEVSFQNQYGNERYKKYLDKVNTIRRDYEQRGQYIPREEALRIAYFEETGKKPQPAPQEQQPQQEQPKFDPYFGKMVGPDGKPLTENPEAVQQPLQQQQPTTQAPGWQQYPEQQQPPQQMQPQQQMPNGFSPQENQNHPTTNPFGQLPDQGINNPYPGNPQATGHLTLDIQANDSDLKAFEDKYGDVPL